jgi:hypothetical protein
LVFFQKISDPKAKYSQNRSEADRGAIAGLLEMRDAAGVSRVVGVTGKQNGPRLSLGPFCQRVAGAGFAPG